MAESYFQKELPNQGIYLSTGKSIKFDIIATSDSWLIGELRAAQRNGMGGVVEIDKARYDDIAKKKREQPLSPDSFPRRAELDPLQFTRPNLAGAGSAAANARPMPDPITIAEPKQFKKQQFKVGKVE